MDLIVGAGIFIAAAAARKVEDRVLDLAWDRVRDALSAALGRKATPEDVTPARVREILDRDPHAREVIEAFGSESRVLRRASLASRVLDGARVLWIDDQPRNNALELAALEAFGVQVEQATSTQMALEALHRTSVDLVISDIARGEDSSRGVVDLPRVRSASGPANVIFYVGVVDARGTPERAFGITARPDDLLHLCIDALERVRA